MTTRTAHTARTVEVKDAHGDSVELTPGTIDDAAEYVYRNGQCLALAIALAERTGWPVHVRHFEDGDDADPCGLYSNLRHASVETPTGTLLDIYGESDADILLADDESYGGALPPFTVPAGEARERLLLRFGGYLEIQDIETATTFVDAVLARMDVPTGHAPVLRTPCDFDGLPGLTAAGYVTDDWNRWQQGDCGAYAIALTDAHPHLRFAVLGETWDGAGDASGGWSVRHFFAHDDTDAYDSAGRHPLPYYGIRGTCDYVELDSDPDWHGLYEEHTEQDYADARDHAVKHRIVTRDPVPYGGLTALVPQPLRRAH